MKNQPVNIRVNIAEIIVILGPPGYDLARKAEEMFDGQNIKLLDVDKIMEQSMTPGGLCNGLPSDQQFYNAIDSIIPELKDLSATRILIGCPRTLRQLHRLRQHKIYPNKVFNIQVEPDLAIFLAQTRLVESGEIIDVAKAEFRAREVYNEYMG